MIGEVIILHRKRDVGPDIETGLNASPNTVRPSTWLEPHPITQSDEGFVGRALGEGPGGTSILEDAEVLAIFARALGVDSIVADDEGLAYFKVIDDVPKQIKALWQPIPE